MPLCLIFFSAEANSIHLFSFGHHAQSSEPNRAEKTMHGHLIWTNQSVGHQVKQTRADLGDEMILIHLSELDMLWQRNF